MALKRTTPLKRTRMKRGDKPLKRTGPPKRRAPMRSKAPKKRTPRGKLGGAVTKANRKKVRARSLGLCEARVARDCTGYGEHTHHRKLRSQGGTNATVNLLDVCNRCHTWIHANPEKALKRGLLVPSWKNPSEWPVTQARS